MKIIALGHRKRVGKDVAADYFVQLIQKANPKLIVKHKSFAEPLKMLSYHLYGWAGLKTGEYYNELNATEREQVLPEIGKSPRQIWIEVGLKMREIYEATWIDLLLQNADCDVCVISDLRFPNEFDKTRQLKGLVIKIERPGSIQSNDGADNALASEHDWDYIIKNQGDLADYYQVLKRFYDETLTEYIKEKK